MRISDWSSYVCSSDLNDYVTPIPAGYDLSSAPLDRLPKWQWTVDGSYEIPFGDHTVTLNGNVAYTARHLSTQSISTPTDNTYLNARPLVHASITLPDITDRYFVRAIGRNLTDKRRSDEHTYELQSLMRI